MAKKLLMIALSPTMAEGKIAKWAKKEGDAFSSGDLLCEVETDKASMDYEASESAVLLKVLVPAGGKAQVGEAIAIIGKAGEDVRKLVAEAASQSSSPAPTPAAPAAAPAAPIPAPPAAAPAAAAQPSAVPPPAAPIPAASAPADYPPSSPLARKTAREKQVDLRFVRGSGPGGRVTEKDVFAYAQTASERRPGLPQAGEGRPAPFGASAAASAPRGVSEIPVSGKRAVIAKRLGDSFFSAPHYYLKKTVIADNLVKARESAGRGREKPVSLNAFIAKIAAAALSRHPEINVFWRGETIESRSAVDIGLAVALPDGLITPVIRDCDLKGVLRIDEEMRSLIDKARTKGLVPEEYEGAGFTITNLGAFGVDEFTAIINPPGSAILAVGALEKRPVVGEGDSIKAAHTMTFTLGCDHRTIDGAVGARFFADFAAMLENPFAVLL